MVTADDWIAIGTGALAAGTFVLAWVTVKTSAAARRHDDEKRAEDRARDDRLRQEALDQAEHREQAERTAREDYEPARCSLRSRRRSTRAQVTTSTGGSP